MRSGGVNCKWCGKPLRPFDPVTEVAGMTRQILARADGSLWRDIRWSNDPVGSWTWEGITCDKNNGSEGPSLIHEPPNVSEEEVQTAIQSILRREET